MKELGLSFNQKWNTDNTLATEVTVEDQVQHIWFLYLIKNTNYLYVCFVFKVLTQSVALPTAGSRTEGCLGYVFCTKHRVRLRLFGWISVNRVLWDCMKRYLRSINYEIRPDTEN